MIIGDVKKIDLGTQSFEQIIRDDNLYVDKSRFIEHVLNNPNQVLLIARHRRLGKSLNMDMLRCFLTQEEDHRALFKSLYIENSPVWKEAHAHPVFYFDFKGLKADNYQTQIYKQVMRSLRRFVDLDELDKVDQSIIQNYIMQAGKDPSGISLLTEYVFQATGKRSYILIDEYDNMLMHNYRSAEYEKLRSYMTDTIEAAVKGNPYLIKAVLTGVMRISKESMFSGLNNIVVYDVFRDNVFTDDYGLTDSEIDELGDYVAAAGAPPLNHTQLAQWYNGFTIDQHPIYNIYSVMSYVSWGDYNCYWGQSGTSVVLHPQNRVSDASDFFPILTDMIQDILNDRRKEAIENLLNGEQIKVPLTRQVSLTHLSRVSDDSSFYSLLVQTGYLAVTGYDSDSDRYMLGIPNKELMIVWKEWSVLAIGVSVHKKQAEVKCEQLR
jgi:hypothetical protein